MQGCNLCTMYNVHMRMFLYLCVHAHVRPCSYCGVSVICRSKPEGQCTCGASWEHLKGHMTCHMTVGV